MVLALIASSTLSSEEGTDCDDQRYFFAYIGVASALVLCNIGSAYGTAKSGVGLASLGVIDHSK